MHSTTEPTEPEAAAAEARNQTLSPRIIECAVQEIGTAPEEEDEEEEDEDEEEDEEEDGIGGLKLVSNRKQREEIGTHKEYVRPGPRSPVLLEPLL